jgi:anthranilate phosphoribosyltransferase
MRHAAPVRRQLNVRTVMNVLGPCVNPARPPVQLLGVADASKLKLVARTLAAADVAEALIVHSAGLDEISLHAETRALRLSKGAVEELVFAPEQAGIERAPLRCVAGGDPAENAGRLRALLKGAGGRADQDIVVLNAAALLMTAGRVRTLRDGAEQAGDALFSGGAGAVLDAFIEASHG